MLKSRLVAAICFGSTLFLSSCGDFNPQFSSYKPDQVTTLAGAEQGASMASTLPWSDVKLISGSAWQALQKPMATQHVAWTNRASGSVGTVMPGPIYLVGFNAGEEIEAPLNLDIEPFLEPAAGNYTAIKNANVRLSPNLQGSKVTMLEIGAAVQAVAHETVEDWYLVAQNGHVIGYVFGSLLSQTEGGDLLLAGGDATRGRLCRELTYTITLNTGETDAWVNGACRNANEPWTVVGGRQLILG